mmetsp:Transcript_38424/g.123529  ORF Transcript_38424/g.123529 Transcript_38424/m.123529 type:complete len:292 (+) Transcript_38424:1235-2110(+)
MTRMTATERALRITPSIREKTSQLQMVLAQALYSGQHHRAEAQPPSSTRRRAPEVYSGPPPPRAEVALPSSAPMQGQRARALPYSGKAPYSVPRAAAAAERPRSSKPLLAPPARRRSRARTSRRSSATSAASPSLAAAPCPRPRVVGFSTPLPPPEGAASSPPAAAPVVWEEAPSSEGTARQSSAAAVQAPAIKPGTHQLHPPSSRSAVLQQAQRLRQLPARPLPRRCSSSAATPAAGRPLQLRAEELSLRRARFSLSVEIASQKAAQAAAFLEAPAAVSSEAQAKAPEEV